MADAVVVIAGMEGALASVVGGLTPAPGRRGADQHRLRRRARGRDGVAHACCRPARRASPWSASTTGTARRARSPGCCRDGPPGATGRWRGSTASPASPATWRWARWSTPGPTLDEVRAPARPARPPGLGPADRGGAARRHRLHPCRRQRGRRRRPHPRRHRALIEDGRAAAAGDRARALAVFRALADRRVRTAPAPGRPGALPRGRRARRHRRRRRDGGRARGARGRRGHAPRRWRPGSGTVRSAHGWLPNPAPGHRAPARGRPDLRARRPPGAHDADRRRPAGHAVLVVRPDARHDDHGVGLRRGRRRDGRPAQLHPGGDRAAGRARRRSGRASPRSCWRPTSTT